MNKKILAAFIGVLIALGMTGCTQTAADTGMAGGQTSTIENTASSQPAQSTASEQTASTGEAATGVITEAEAKAAALEVAGLSEADVTFMKVKLGRDDGRQVYDIEFYTGNTEYDFEIDAATGAVLSYDNDYEGTIQAATTEVITEAEAKAAALEMAGLSESDVTFIKVKLEMDDGRQVYDIEFYAENTEYDYELDAATGAVLSYDNDYEGNINAAVSAAQGGDIGIEAAKEIALTKVSGATADQIRIKQDYDNGMAVYEGTIVYNERKYDFEIKAADGNILEWEEESVYDD